MRLAAGVVQASASGSWETVVRSRGWIALAVVVVVAEAGIAVAGSRLVAGRTPAAACQRGIRRQIAHHVGKLGALGVEVALCRTAEPEPDGTGQTKAT